MNNKSKVALIVTGVIWLLSLIISFCEIQTSHGYSLFILVLLPISLLVYLGNFFQQENKEESKKKTK